MAFQAGGQRPAPRPGPGTLEARSAGYLQDYAVLLDSVPFPSLVVDHRWDVLLTNGAFRTLFQGVEPHPTANPVPTSSGSCCSTRTPPRCWATTSRAGACRCSPTSPRPRSGTPTTPGLHAIRRDIAQDPIMDAAYRHGLPHWLRAVGGGPPGTTAPYGPCCTRTPAWGTTECRLLVETTSVLEEMGCRRVTFVLRETPRPMAGTAGPAAPPPTCAWSPPPAEPAGTPGSRPVPRCVMCDIVLT